MRMIFARWTFPLLVALMVCGATPRRAEAAPDPVIASVMSAGAMTIPLTLTTILWATGQGKSEGIRFDVGMASLGVAATVAPSVGQIYAGGGTDAFVTFLLRTVTSSVMLTGVGFRLRGADNRRSMGLALALTGGVPTLFLALYDIYAASVSAKEARYEAGYAQIGVPPELVGLAACGPIPCAVGGADDPLAEVHAALATRTLGASDQVPSLTAAVVP